MRIRKLVGMLVAAVLVVGAVAIQGDAKTKKKGSTKKTTTSTTSSSSTFKKAGNYMDFMGIPINGTISSFSTKLATKGFKATKNALPTGTKTFSGSYFNRPADLYVYYIPTTKLVYRVKVVITEYSQKAAENQILRLLHALEEKYDEGDTEKGTYDGYASYLRIVYDKEGFFVAGIDLNGELQYHIPYLGWVDLFMSYDYGEYMVFVDFYDWENNEKYEEWLKTTI